MLSAIQDITRVCLQFVDQFPSGNFLPVTALGIAYIIEQISMFICERYLDIARAHAVGTASVGISHVFGISAQTLEVLETLHLRYFDWLHDARNSWIPISDIAYTATARRQLYPFGISIDVWGRGPTCPGSCKR